MTIRDVKVIFLTLMVFRVSEPLALAAVGCGLNDPDRDVPGSSRNQRVTARKVQTRQEA